MATLHYCSDSLNFTTVQFQVEKEGSNLHGNISQEQKHCACVLNTSPRSVPSLNGIIFQLNRQANSSYWIALPENWSKAKVDWVVLGFFVQHLFASYKWRDIHTPSFTCRAAYLFQCCNSKVNQGSNWWQNHGLKQKINQCKKWIYAQHLAPTAAGLIYVGIYLVETSSGVAVTFYNSCNQPYMA